MNLPTATYVRGQTHSPHSKQLRLVNIMTNLCNQSYRTAHYTAIYPQDPQPGAPFHPRIKFILYLWTTVSNVFSLPPQYRPIRQTYGTVSPQATGPVQAHSDPLIRCPPIQCHDRFQSIPARNTCHLTCGRCILETQRDSILILRAIGPLSKAGVFRSLSHGWLMHLSNKASLAAACCSVFSAEGIQ